MKLLSILAILTVVLFTFSSSSFSGTIVAWGQDSIGNGYIVSTVPEGTGFVAIAAGVDHALALKKDGSIVSWGHDGYGQVSNTPEGNDFTAIAAGSTHGLALRNDGSITIWGFNGYGEVSNAPTGNDFIAISGSFRHHFMALKADGSIVSWGYDLVNVVSDTPTGTGYIAIAGGLAHSLALHSDGSIISWGQDINGLVSGVPAGNDFVAIAAGGHHSLALKKDGSIVSWGYDSYGQVRNTPEGNDFVAIAGGGNSSLAIRNDGSIVYWGYQIIGNTPDGGRYEAVSGSNNFSLALKSETIKLNNPNGGEILYGNEFYTMQWESTLGIENVLILYSIDNGNNWLSVEPANIGNSGVYKWLAPAFNSNECLVRIYDASNPALYDISDGVFTISPKDTSAYPTLYDILGEPAPAITESGRDFATYSIPDVNVVAFILLENAGFANENLFGIYSAYDPQEKLQLFSGADCPTDTATIQFDAVAGTVRNLHTGQTANIDNYFGFYLTTPQNGGTTYYTDLTRNPDLLEHGLIYNTSVFAGVFEGDPDAVIAFEDTLGLGDRDYNDMVVGIINAVPLPGSQPYCIRDIPGDVNHDCKLNLIDFVVIATHWLECNLDPKEACWQ
jgi:alpha-tubulin suppressor-like RCC1 family protein